jgi:hypothetical protein
VQQKLNQNRSLSLQAAPTSNVNPEKIGISIRTIIHSKSMKEFPYSIAAAFRLLRRDDPLDIIREWSDVAFAVFTACWLLQQLRVFQLIGKFLTITRTYTDDASMKMEFNNLLDVMEKPSTLSWRFGFNLHNGRRVPTCIVCLSPPFYAWSKLSVVLHQDKTCSVHCVQPSWMSPLVNDPIWKDSNRFDKNEISIIEDSNGGTFKCNEIAVNEDEPPPPEILSRSRKAAELIKDIYIKPRAAYSRVVVLMGNPGTGKSLSTRILALMLDAVLTDSFNPGESKNSPASLIRLYGTSTRAFIMVLEEFDGILKNIMTGKAPAQANVKTKSDWNRMLDTWKRKLNGILVLTTNLDESRLLTLCKDDTSFLRKGRVDLVLRFDEEDDGVTVVHDFFQKSTGFIGYLPKAIDSSSSSGGNSPSEHSFTSTYLNEVYDDDTS